MGKVVELEFDQISAVGVLIVAVGISIVAFLVLVFLSFQVFEALFSVRNRKLKRIDQNQQKYVMKEMDHFRDRYLYHNGNYKVK